MLPYAAGLVQIRWTYGRACKGRVTPRQRGRRDKRGGEEDEPTAAFACFFGRENVQSLSSLLRTKLRAYGMAGSDSSFVG
jgi:hypothetical protein